MTTHDDVQALVDGELSPEQAVACRTHLAVCPECQVELYEVLQLAARLGPDSTSARRPKVLRSRFLSRQTAWAALAGGALAAALTVAFFRLPPTVDWKRSGQRSLEARLTWGKAAEYLPYDTTRGQAAREAVPLTALAALEAKGDWQGLGATSLLAGDATRAREALRRAPSSPSRDVDLAAADMALGDLDEALSLLDGVLASAPRHPQALWNRGLALQSLGLRAGAAAAFGEVAQLGEPGWSPEAASRARKLAAMEEEERARFQAVTDAAAALVLDAVPMPPDLVRASPMLARISFFLGLWSRGSAAEVRALAPLAADLDALAGDHRLQGWVDRIARRDFSLRAPLAAQYRRLVRSYYAALQHSGWGPRLRSGADPAPLSPEEGAALIARIERSGETDLLLGALSATGRIGTELDLYKREAIASGDVAFHRAAELEEARLAHADGDAVVAEGLATQALVGCEGAAADYRCLQLHQWLAQLYKEQYRLVEAQEHAQKALDLARAQFQLGMVDECLVQLGDIARLRGMPGLARAFLGERVLRTPGDLNARSYFHESLAVLRIVAFDAAGARAELRLAAQATPLTRVGAYTLSDVIRMAREPSDQEWLGTVLTTLRATDLSKAEQALMDHIEGRALIDTDPAGADLLRKSIEEASQLKGDGVAQNVRASDFRELRIDAGRRGAHGEVFQLLHEEGAAPDSPPCAVAIEAQDDRVEIAVRSARGVLAGRYEKGHGLPDARTLLPSSLREALAGCEAVKVFASPPVHGQSGLLPDDVAWSYAGPSASASAAVARNGAELVVQDVEAPTQLNLPRLATWSDVARPGVTTLAGAEATPRRVLKELANAGLVELHTHGLVDLGVSDASLLVLSPDPESRRWALTAQDIRRERLTGSPVVLLAACHAARVAPFIHELWSLPRAFTDAGARAVIAAPGELPDVEAREFFLRVMERVRRGASAPLALRDERVRWLAEGRSDWVRKVLVFE